MKNKDRFIMGGEGIVINPKLTKQEQELSDKLDEVIKKGKIIKIQK